MTWHTPEDWSYKEVPGSNKMNEQVRDNLNYLKASLPAGVILPYAKDSAPDQWLICDGSAVSRSTYSDLFTIIGTTFGSGDGSTTFNLPDLRGKFPIGKKSTDADFDALAKSGGAKTKDISHVHTIAHTHTYSGNTGNCSADEDGGDGSGHVANNNHDHNFSGTTSSASSGNSGSGGSAVQDIMNPYLVLNYIIKY